MISWSHRIIWIWLLTVFIASSGMAQDQSPSHNDSSGQEYVGCIAIGFETLMFNPVTLRHDEAWWVASGPDELFEQIESIPVDEHGMRKIYVRIKGSISKLGHYGHLGAFDREISIRTVLELRPYQNTDGACGMIRPREIQIRIGSKQKH